MAEITKHAGNTNQKMNGTGGQQVQAGTVTPEILAALTAKNPALEGQKIQDAKRVQAQATRDSIAREEAMISQAAANAGLSPEEYMYRMEEKTAQDRQMAQLAALRNEQAVENQANAEQYGNPNGLAQIPGY
jgi:hypothetical protein